MYHVAETFMGENFCEFSIHESFLKRLERTLQSPPIHTHGQNLSVGHPDPRQPGLCSRQDFAREEGTHFIYSIGILVHLTCTCMPYCTQYFLLPLHVIEKIEYLHYRVHTYTHIHFNRYAP